MPHFLKSLETKQRCRVHPQCYANSLMFSAPLLKEECGNMSTWPGSAKATTAVGTSSTTAYPALRTRLEAYRIEVHKVAAQKQTKTPRWALGWYASTPRSDMQGWALG